MYGTEPKITLKGHMNREKVPCSTLGHLVINMDCYDTREDMEDINHEGVRVNSFNEYKLYDSTLKLVKEARR